MHMQPLTDRNRNNRDERFLYFNEINTIRPIIKMFQFIKQIHIFCLTVFAGTFKWWKNTSLFPAISRLKKSFQDW